MGTGCGGAHLNPSTLQSQSTLHSEMLFQTDRLPWSTIIQTCHSLLDPWLRKCWVTVNIISKRTCISFMKISIVDIFTPLADLFVPFWVRISCRFSWFWICWLAKLGLGCLSFLGAGIQEHTNKPDSRYLWYLHVFSESFASKLQTLPVTPTFWYAVP